MRRWDGWGSDQVDYHLTAAAKAHLADVIGASAPGPSAGFEDVLRRVPRGRLSAHKLISDDPALRLRHARGQSLPDWIALRFGAVDRFPDGVAFPNSEDDLEDLLAFARGTGACVIPYGGGTSVVGHINPPRGDRPVVTVDMSRMSKLSRWDEASRLADFEAGISGPHLEAQLRALGFTMGHFPQSFEYSTLGGWIATRSSGQQSLYYGRIEDMFAGGRMIAPEGALELPPFPASAAGPDLRHLVLGSEGRLGIIARAVVRVAPLPEEERFHAVFFPDWEGGISAVREMVRASLPVSMLRLADAVETGTTLVLAGRERVVRMLERLLRARGLGKEKCLLLIGITGLSEAMRKVRRAALEAARAHGGVYIGRRMGSEWRKTRFLTPYLRNTLWNLGYAVDTLESAFPWSRLESAADSILSGLRSGLEAYGEKVLAFAHISHIYKTGAGLYFTHIYRIAPDAARTLARWKTLKDEASRAIVARGGTISHQHGVGTDHRPYLEAEKGKLGINVLSKIAQTFDPAGIMNPGKLVDGGPQG
jgi:alkyldihydroxyacetonephosphate synthase